MSDDRPKRKAVTAASRKASCERQGFQCKDCGKPVHYVPGSKSAADHRPPLRLRDILPDGSDYWPLQNDPAYIDIVCEDCHKIRTFVKNGADFSDLTKIARERRREKKRANPKRKKAWGKGRKLQSRPFQKRVK